jgi:S-adenosylmethionine:tRNA ribosyltransferase-isomerase
MSKQNNTRWNCLVGNLKKWIEKEIVIVTNNIQLSAQIVERYPTHVCIDFKWEPSNLTFSEILDCIGLMPIPPYIKRNSAIIDKSRYQTIYSDKIGSVAAPTAGLHFTKEVLNAINKKEIKTLTISLHVGAGTFKPVKSKMMQGHDMHSEWIEVELKLIIDLIENKKKIISVGTTSLRVIESLYWMGLKTYKNNLITLVNLEIKQWEVYDLDDDKITPNQCLQALAKWMQKNKLEKLICRTQILIAPPYQLKICDGIITNFHQPQSTLLLLISAIVGENWKKIYQYAIQNDFRFLSYGDSSLLLK